MTISQASFGKANGRGELYNDDPTLGDARLCGTTASLCGVEAAAFMKRMTGSLTCLLN